MTIENIENHMAYTCQCGGVNFALLKSGAIECNKCSTPLADVKWWAGGMGAQLARAIRAEAERDSLLDQLAASQRDVIDMLGVTNERNQLRAELDAITKTHNLLIDDFRDMQEQRDDLQAKLDALAKQGPVAHRAWFDADNGARWLFTLWPEEEKLDVEWVPLYASPKALEPLTDEQIEQLRMDICDLYQLGKLAANALTRAVERAHGIGGE